ncbi:MAG: YggS family pyridoxal phosphate-dependent enzyme [Anaerolineae bacterium]|nr:YggS family pyridoxal phosphate-dependent enzyme [Anaerolineae bacterium]
MIDEDKIANNLETIRERIAQAAARGGRDSRDVVLVAVSKTFPPEAVAAAYRAGQRDFGENRAEEGTGKMPLVDALLPDAQLTWHMIGHMQRRKVPLVVAHFDMVHSVDRMPVAVRLSTLAQQARRTIPVLLECNVAGESSKYGFDAAGWEHDMSLRQRFMDHAREILDLPGLEVSGLMTMAPLVEDAEEVRPVFSSLRALRDALQQAFPDHEISHLSMGMSNDFEVAVEQGATMVRIGRAIFGPRIT